MPFSVTVYIPPGVPLIVAGPLFTVSVTGKLLSDAGARIVNDVISGVLFGIASIAEIVCDVRTIPIVRHVLVFIGGKSVIISPYPSS